MLYSKSQLLFMVLILNVKNSCLSELGKLLPLIFKILNLQERNTILLHSNV